MGLDFLRHIERTRVLVHLLDMVPMDETSPIDSYHAIREELFAYSPKLAAKPEILVANKMDLTGASEALADLRSALPGKQILAISAATGTGLRPLLEDLWQLIIATPASEAFVEAPPSIALNLDGPRESSAKLADAQLAAEVEAIKADDVRKGKYYRRTKADRTRDRNKKRLS